jgi:uncharacterized membrane protein
LKPQPEATIKGLSNARCHSRNSTRKSYFHSPHRQPSHPPDAGAVSDRLFVGTLVTDVAYWKTAEMMWADFSAWLLFAGLVMGVLAAITGLIDFLSNRLIRALAPAWFHLAGNAVVLVLAFFNALVHSRDAWTSVVPAGLVLSALTVILMLFTGWMGGAMVYRHRVGVGNDAQDS